MEGETVEGRKRGTDEGGGKEQQWNMRMEERKREETSTRNSDTVIYVHILYMYIRSPQATKCGEGTCHS